MAATLESLGELTSWEGYRTFMKERLKQLPDTDCAFFISKEKVEFQIEGKPWKGYAVLMGPKGELAVKKIKKEGVQFREGTCAREKAKEFLVRGIAPNLVKQAKLTFMKLRLGYSLEGDGDGAGADAAAPAVDAALLGKRLSELVAGIKKVVVVEGESSAVFLKEAVLRASQAKKLAESDPAGAMQLVEEGQEFLQQALVATLEGGAPTEAEAIEARRKELLDELKQAAALKDPANDGILRQAAGKARDVLTAVGKKDHKQAEQLLDEIEGLLSEVVEGPEPPADADPDLAGLSDWKAYREFMKVNLKRLPAEGGAIFISRKKQDFSIDGKLFKGSAVLVGKKGRITVQILKKEGVLFREGTCQRDGKSLLVAGIPAELLKGAKKTFLKLRLGKKIVPHGELPPDEDESAEDATGDPTGSRRLDKEIKEVAENLVKLRESLEAQKKYLTNKEQEAVALKKAASDARDAALDLEAKGEDATAALDAADKAQENADHTRYISKDLAGITKRAEIDLRELTEKLHRIKDSEDPYKAKRDQLKKLKAEVAGKILDSRVASLDPSDPKTGQLLAKQIKARFGVKLRLYEQRKDGTDAAGNQKYKDRRRNPKKEAESLKQLYLTMSKAPDFPKSTLKKIDLSLRPDDATSEGGWYSGSERKVGLTVSRPKASFDYSGQLGSAKYFPDGVDEDCKPRNAEPIKYFDWATLHEVAHAVDEKHRFMSSKGSGKQYGGWKEYGNNVAPIAKVVADEFGDGLGAEDKRALEAYALALMKRRNPAPERSDEEKERRGAVKTWYEAVRVKNSIWWNGSQCVTHSIDGIVYQEAYDWSGGWWNSYELAARKKGIHGYQFRAPGEWFAELYAAYYSDKLKPSHPFVPDLAKLEVPSK